jgi:hypothetical protein
MTSRKCPICGRTVSVLSEPLRDFTDTLQELKVKGQYAHSSCIIKLLKAALERQRNEHKPLGRR